MLFFYLLLARHAWNSDLLYLEAIYRDLFVDPHPLSEFNFSASTFVFPDIPFYFFFRSILPHLNATLMGYVTLQWTLLLILYRRWLKGASDHLLVLVPLIMFGIFDQDWYPLFYPDHHGGQWILGTLLLFSFGPLQRPESFAFYWLIPAIVGLFASCDLLYALNGILPFGITLLISSVGAGKKGKFFKSFFWCFLCLAFTVIFYFLFRKITGSYFGWNKPLFGYWDRARDFALTFLRPSLFNGLLWPSLIQLGFRWKKDSTAQFLLLAIVTSALSIVLTGVWVDHLNVRYFMVLIPAMTYGWMQLLLTLQSIHRGIPWGITAGFLGLTALQAHSLHQQQTESPWKAPYSKSHECLDHFIHESGLREGISNYWPAKWLSFLSKESAKVLQVTDRLEPQYWINNHDWYKNFHPRFVIVRYMNNGPISEESLKTLGFNQPTQKVKCDLFEIWVFPEGTPLVQKTTADRYFKNFHEFR